MKRLTYYIVIDNDLDLNNSHLYTVCQSKKDCEEFIDRYLLVQNFEHYKSWCDLRKLEHNEESWRQYSKSVSIQNKYKILKVKNTLNNVLGMLRKSYDCVHLDCSYETDFERSK